MSVYLHLFHGRKDPEQDMADWGEDGPLLGPLEWVQITYLCDVRIGLPEGDDAFLAVHEDMVYYAGMYYGDFDILSEERFKIRGVEKKQAEKFDPVQAVYKEARDV